MTSPPQKLQSFCAITSGAVIPMPLFKLLLTLPSTLLGCISVDTVMTTNVSICLTTTYLCTLSPTMVLYQLSEITLTNNLSQMFTATLILLYGLQSCSG